MSQKDVPAYRTPGTLWAKAIEKANAEAKKPEGRGDAFVYFVGPRGSGKSTLLNRFLYPSRVEVPKPSEGIEYTYARKPAAYDHEKKYLAHIWEIGGSQEFAEEVVSSDQLFLTVKQVTTAVVVIVVDLSDPSTVLSSLLYWLDQLKKKLAATYEKFEKKGLQLPEQLRQRAKSKLYAQNEDKDTVYHSGISLVLAATKYDTFKDSDPELKKIMARALRYVAHAHGAFLVYLSSLHVPGQSKGDEELLSNFAGLMNHLVFTGLEKRPTLKLGIMADHVGPIMVPAGMDKLRDIGRPRGGASDGNVTAGIADWRDIFEKTFPGGKEKEGRAAGRGIKFEVPEQYTDEEIDAARSRKLAELDNIRKEALAAIDAARKKALLAKQQQSDGAAASAAKKKAAASANGHAPPAQVRAAKASS